MKTHVPDNADDFKPRANRRSVGGDDADPPADSVDRTKGALRERRVDDDRTGLSCEIARIETAASYHRLLQLVEEIDRYPCRAYLEGTPRLSRCGGILVNVHQLNGMVHSRQRGRKRDRAHVRLTAKLADERSLRLCDVL